MATQITVGDYDYWVDSFTVSEDSTPLAADDTTGSVGSIQFGLMEPDPFLALTPGMEAIRKHGPGILIDKPVSVHSDEWGTISGTVSTASPDGSGIIRVTAVPTLGILNAYNVTAQPFTGSLGALFRYYCALAGVSPSNVTVHASLNARPVVAIGWVGELWFHLKQLALAHGAEIALLGGNITLRPARTRDAVRGYEVSAAPDIPLPTLAQAIEVYRYEVRPVTNELVYPPGGWKPETQVLNVNAGETAEYTLELSASVSSIQTPTHQMTVTPEHDTTSVFTVVANDGLPVSPSMWTDMGGRVEIAIASDTTHLLVKLVGATGVVTSGGEAATNFSLALGADTTGNRYSTLRIVGTGVAYTREVTRIRTGVPASKTGTDIGTTIDNIFLNSTDQVYRAGTAAAARCAAATPSLSSTVISITGTAGQTFGNAGGSRVWDERTNKWYRVRNASITPGGISITADDDTSYDDHQAEYEGLTYAQVQQRLQGLTYGTDALTGIKRE